MATGTINFPWHTGVFFLCSEKKTCERESEFKIARIHDLPLTVLGKSHVCYLVIYVHSLIFFDLIGSSYTGSFYQHFFTFIGSLMSSRTVKAIKWA